MAWNVADRYKLDMTGATDNALKLVGMQGEIAALVAFKKPLPKLVFPEGICSFSAWPNMAFHNLEMQADGQAILRYTGSGDAITFMGEETGGLAGLGKRNIRFDGFTIDPGATAHDSLVVASCHAGYFRVKVVGAGPPPGDGTLRSAINIKFCVCSEFHPTISQLDRAILGNDLGFSGSLDIIGINLDRLFDKPDWPASACLIVNPIIEGLLIGIQSTHGWFTQVRDGTIETNRMVGIYVKEGADNVFKNVEMEGNALDIWCTKDAHDNVFDRCGDGHGRHLTTKIDGYMTNNTIIKTGSLWR